MFNKISLISAAIEIEVVPSLRYIHESKLPPVPVPQPTRVGARRGLGCKWTKLATATSKDESWLQTPSVMLRFK